jgi:dipeptidyl aminopeptidase/acylaminoacyl peptidase
MKKLLSIFLLFLPTIVFTQNEKKTLDFSVYDQWQSVSNTEISNNGIFLSYELVPFKGNSELEIFDAQKKQKHVFPRARYAQFSPNNNFVVFRIQPDADSVRQLKLKKVKSEKLPKDSIGIIILANQQQVKFAGLKSFQIAKKESDWMFFLYDEAEKKEEKPDSAATAEIKKKKVEVKDKNAPKTSHLSLLNPITNNQFVYQQISEADMADNGSAIAFVKIQNDSLLKSTVYIFNTKTSRIDSIFQQEGLVKKVEFDHLGKQLAFIFSADTVKEKTYSLYFWDGAKNVLKKIVDTLSTELPKKWTVSEHGTIFFSENDKKLFFGASIRPEQEPEDTMLAEEKVQLDLWSWTDYLLQPQQKAQLKKEKNKTYLATFIVEKQKLVLLADKDIEDIQTGFKANQNYFLASSDIKYQKASSWESPSRRDFYRIDVNTGERLLILEAQPSWASLSPNGDKLLFFNYLEQEWYVKNLLTNSLHNLTAKIDVAFHDEYNDMPMLASPYGVAGWEENGKFVLIYDRFDIWKINAEKDFAAVNLTASYGRNNKIRLHYMRLDAEKEHFTNNETIYLDGFNETSKQAGYYELSLSKPSAPKELYKGDFALNTWKKAKDADAILFQQQTVKDYPDVWLSNLQMQNPRKISAANPQQENYNWATVELVKWITPDGTEEEGLLYKPENFDPNKKYPMIVYFYELYSDEIHYHYIPSPSRSTINFTFYASNEYLVFIPNIRYKEGYPGMSAYNYVLSGTLALLNSRQYIDKNRLGLQGQSWGGYQVAYIVTQTNMFAAASAGAPVSNMTSAYGGIRWESGMSRMFQYEHTQSRIGGTLWEKPFQYIENSPIFFVPKITTPLLIMHNDEDGAVPWYQGIELFVAMRRLNKPAWMLSYNGEPHNLRGNSSGRKDLSIRLKQFFDVYLKDAPSPVWMTNGIPAEMKGKTLGYELNQNK